MKSEIPDSGFASPDSEKSCKMSQSTENHTNSYDNSRWRQSCLKNVTQAINEANKELDTIKMENETKQEVSMTLKYILFLFFQC